MELLAADDLGVASTLLGGKNGCRLLRGIPVGKLSKRFGSNDGWSITESCATSSSKWGRSLVDFIGLPVLGNGDGLRGPSGRRSLELCDNERERREGEAIGEMLGVSRSVCGVDGLGVWVRELGLIDAGGSSTSERQFFHQSQVEKVNIANLHKSCLLQVFP